MKGRILAKEGDWSNARDTLKQYKSRVQSGKDAMEAGDLLFEVSEGEVASKKAKQSRKAGLYQACVEAATDALKTATHSVSVRELRAECALEAGDVQQAVGDMM
jgi:DnaJ family protein C protein 3